MEQPQASPISQSLKKKERPPSWPVEKEESSKVQRRGYHDEKSDLGDSCDDSSMLRSHDLVHPENEPKLCAEQEALVELIMHRHNVFYTGRAGCGKSVVLRAFVRRMRAEQRKVRIIACSGIAALEAGGMTLHSFAGWTPDSMKKPIEQLESEACGEKNWKRFKRTDVLVIDEISQIENHLLERLNRVMKHARRDKKAGYSEKGRQNEKPFGGVQVIITGDFFQLPPVRPFKNCIECGKGLVVLKRESRDECQKYQCQNERCEHFRNINNDTNKWAFLSNTWKECDFIHVGLKEAHRQTNVWFLNFLDGKRLGQGMSQDIVGYFKKKKKKDDGIVAVKLFSKREQVAAENEQQLGLIENKCMKFRCFDNFDWNPDHVGLDKLLDPGTNENSLKALDNHRFDTELELKKDMPVMLLINLDFKAGLVNGSQGTIVGFERYSPEKLPEPAKPHQYKKTTLIQRFTASAPEQEWPIVKFSDGEERTIYPHCMMNEYGDAPKRDEEYRLSLLSRT